MTDLPSSRAVTRTGCPPTIGMEDENFLEKTTSTEREEDTMTLISFPNKMLQMYIIMYYNVISVLSSPGGDTGGERVSLVPGGTGADSSVVHHLAVSVGST